MKLFSRSFFLGLLLLLSAPRALSAGFFEEMSGLMFEVPDVLSIRDVSEKTPSVQKILEITLSSGEKILEVRISDQPLSKVLEESQLRIINSQQLSNREILETTGVEVVGSSFDGQYPMRAMIFTTDSSAVSVILYGNSLSTYEDFLSSLQKTKGFLDTVLHPLSSEIHEVAERGIFAGYQQADGVVFKPQQTINRAEFLKVLVLSQPGNTVDSIENFYRTFRNRSQNQSILPDVDREAWFAPYIFYAFEKGWVKGYPDGTFRPGNTLNIAEASKMLLESRAVSVPMNSEVWFQPYIDFFTEKSILNPRGSQFEFAFTNQPFNTFDPCTRAQAAAFIARLLFLEDHPGIDMYGRLVPLEGLDFVFENENLVQVLEVGSSLSERSHKFYSVYQTTGNALQPATQVLVYYPEEWTELERLGILDRQKVVYLGENTSSVYAVRSICEGDHACIAALKESFSLSRQDLEVFDDFNIDFSFITHAGVQFEKILEPSLETVIVKRDAVQQLVILSAFSIQNAPFVREIPVYQAVVGNRTWKVFKENVRGVPRLSLVTDFGNKVMVASIPNVETFTGIDPKVFRILRSLE